MPVHRRRVALVLLALFAVAAVLFGWWFKGHARRSGLQRASLQQLQTDVKNHPHDPLPRYYLARAYARAQQADKAIREYEALLRLNPHHAKALNDLGTLWMLLGSNEEAQKFFERALRADPHFARPRANLGRLYVTTKRPYLAAEELARAAEIEPKDAAIWRDLGAAYRATMNFKKSLDAYRQATTLAPQNAELWWGMGEAYRGLAESAQSEKAFREALRLNPQHPQSLEGLGRVLLERARSRKDLLRAKRVLHQAVTLDPRNVEAFYTLGCVQRQLVDEQGAARSLEKALALFPSHYGAMYQLGLAYVAVGREKEGRELLKRFETILALQRELRALQLKIADQPDDVKARVRLAELYLLFQSPQEAVGECRAVLRSNPNQAQARHLLRIALQALGEVR
jgi:cytochrome c-type biogenesis protein CcmH/NrfG